MKDYVFGIGVLLMLSFSLTGMTWTAAQAIRRASGKAAPLSAIAVGFASLIVVITALVWSVPPRG
jgi:hypothetical protein